MHKSTESLFGKIKEDLAAYSSSNLIDEGRFHKDVKYIISLLGVMWFREAEIVLSIENYSSQLPEDFKQLDSAFRCDQYSVESNQLDGVVLKKLSFSHYPEIVDPDTHEYTCGDYRTQPSKCIFNRQEEILIQRGETFFKLNAPRLLRPGNINTKKNLCTSNCQNIYSTSADTFTIENKNFYTNFKDGTVYLSYHAFPLDEDGYPMIPDNEMIEKCIEYYIKSNIFENLWLNGDADVERKYAKMEEMYMKHLAQAKYETKLPTFASMVNKIRLNRRSLDMYQL